MKKIFWLCGGYPSLEGCREIIDAYVAGGCDGIEWSVPPADPYREQAHLQAYMRKARENCPVPMEHLAQMAECRKKYPEVEIFPSIYQESVLDIGPEKLMQFCLDNGMDTLFLIGNYDDTLKRKLSEKMKLTTSVSYYMTEEELARAREVSGFIYMQALPYQEELDAGYTSKHLKYCVNYMRSHGLDRPIYCAKGIKTPEDAEFVRRSGADGYILGSVMLQYYDDLSQLTRVVSSYKK